MPIEGLLAVATVVAIVGRIVDAHGWTLDVTERVDGGTRFGITGVTTVSPARRAGTPAAESPA